MRILIGSLLGAVLLFGWGFVFWTMLPMPRQMISALPGHDQVVDALQATGTETGIYKIPRPMADQSEEALEAFKQANERGPIAMLYFRAEGEQAMGPQYFGYGFLQMFLASLAAAIALSACDVEVYPGRVMIVVWMGIFCALWERLSDVMWFRFPMTHFWLSFVYTVSSALILGLVLAIFVRPPQRA